MPILANDAWQPLTPQGPWVAVLEDLGISPAEFPGIWQIRGVSLDDPSSLQGLSADSEALDELRSALQTAQGPVAFRIGDAEIRRLPVNGKPRSTSVLRRYGTIALGILVKFKLVLVFLSVLVSLVVYGLAFGWAFGAGLIAVIAIHEMGHVAANRIKGIPASLPIFIPLLGAFIQLKQSPRTAADEAFIGVMGPVFGLAAAIASLALAVFGRLPFFFAVAEMGFLLHVFNLMPVLPLDGGRTVGFWRWKAWIPGIVGVLVVLFYNPFSGQFIFDPFTLLIVAIIFVSLVREPRMKNAAYVAIPTGTRWLYTTLWAFLLLISIVGYWGVGQIYPL